MSSPGDPLVALSAGRRAFSLDRDPSGLDRQVKTAQKLGFLSVAQTETKSDGGFQEKGTGKDGASFPSAPEKTEGRV